MDKQLAHDIIKVCSKTEKGATVEDCAEQLDLKGGQLAQLFTVFDELARSGVLMRIAGERYLAAQKSAEITGIYKGYTKNFGFVITNDLKEDVYITESNRHTAMNNDKVQVRLLQSSRGHRQEGEIIRIIERANTTVVGTYDRQQNCGFVIPDDERLREDIYVPLDKTLNARSSARVLVKITRWPEENRKAEGEITEVLGYDGDKPPTGRQLSP